MLYLLSTYNETIVDGDGIRYSIYLAGCSHKCPGCHNVASWNPKFGTPLTEEKITDIINDINSNPLLDGVTFSGGDPFFNPEEARDLIARVRRETGLNIWCYTGYTIEEILDTPQLRTMLPYIDILVEGPFIKELYSPYLDFRGSSNQRIINVPELLLKEKAMMQSTTARYKCV